MKNVGNLTDQLPIGLEIKPGKLDRRFICRELDGKDLRFIYDSVYRKNHPMEWVARVLCLVLEEIAGERVYAQYRQLDYEKIPDIVKKITSADASYILVAGHAFTFGEKLDEVTDKCSNCGRKIVVSMDLSKLSVTRNIEDKFGFTVKLTKPVGFKTDEKDMFSIKGRLFDTLDFRYPLIGDTMNNEEYFKPNDRGDFDYRIMSDSLMVIFGTDAAPMSSEYLQFRRHSIWDSFSAMALKEVRRGFADIPSIEFAKECVCPQCSEDTLVGINPTQLFPRV